MTVGRRQILAVLGGALVLLALLSSFRAMLGEDLRSVVPLPTGGAFERQAMDRSGSLLMYGLDQRFVIWAIARNARTWTSAPHRIYDAELCYPEPLGLAMGEPLYTAGLLGAPFWLLTGDPLLTYNAVLFVLPLISAFVMFWVVWRWTNSAAAGLVSALLYAFHIVKIGDTVHAYYADTVWVLLAIHFFLRWLQAGGWGPLLGFVAATALQVGVGLYALVGAMLFAAPIAVMAVWRLGTKRTRPIEWAVAVAALLLVVIAAFAPYLAKTASGELSARALRVHLAWSWLLPWKQGSPGWLLTSLALLAFVPLPRPTPRTAEVFAARRGWILAGVALALIVAAGGNAGDRLVATLTESPVPPALPDPYSWLAALVPPLTAVRAPLWIASAAYLGLAILAGMGTARVLRACPTRLSLPLGLALVGAAFMSVQLPTGHFVAQRQRPQEEELDFFDALSAKGNSGPILELPTRNLGLERGTKSLTLAAYHARPTSRCYNSFIPTSVRRAWEFGEALPELDALGALAEMGFTTLILRHPPFADEALALRVQLDALADETEPPIERVHRDGTRSAWSLVPGEVVRRSAR